MRLRFRPGSGARQAFTLIEIMVAIGIVAVILTIAIPSVYQQMHKDSMRQAVADVVEACSQARARAIMDGVVVEVSIRPKDRRISAMATGSRAQSAEAAMDAEGGAPSGGGGPVFAASISEHIWIEEALVFQAADRALVDEVICKFYPNGTCDPLEVRLKSDRNELRIITTDVITGIADVEVSK